MKGSNSEASRQWCKFLVSESVQICEILCYCTKVIPALSENKVHSFLWEWHVFYPLLDSLGQITSIPLT